MAEREFPNSDTLHAAKLFTRMAPRAYLGSKLLKIRELFRQFLDRRPQARADVAAARKVEVTGRTVTQASNKLVWATALVYTATQNPAMLGEEDV